MSKCPRCGNAITEDFGLIECNRCGAQLVVEIDGSINLSEASADAHASPPPAPAAIELSEAYDGDLSAESPGDIANNLANELSDEVGVSADGESAADITPIEEEVHVIEALADIKGFANSVTSTTNDGLWQYTLVFHGIDTADLKKQLFEVLEDKRLKLDIDTLKKQVKNGQLTLARISPVKASYIVQGCMQLPLDIHWQQHSSLQDGAGMEGLT